MLKLLHCVQKKNTHSHFLSYLHELFVDLNKNCSEYTQGLTDSDNVTRNILDCDQSNYSSRIILAHIPAKLLS